MFLPLFDHLKASPFLGRFAAQLYTSALDEQQTLPNPLQFIDILPGNVEQGRAVCQGILYTETDKPCALSVDIIENVDENFIPNLHDFNWLRDLRAFSLTSNGELARSTARGILDIWLNKHRVWNKITWAPDITARRLYHWIASYEWLGYGTNTQQELHLQHAIYIQFQHLNRAEIINDLPFTQFAMDVWLGLLTSTICLDDPDDSLEHNLAIFDQWLKNSLLPDGMVIGRSPKQAYQLACLLVIVRSVLIKAEITPSLQFTHSLNQLMDALNIVMLPDGHPTQLQATRADDMPHFGLLQQICGQRIGYRATRALAKLEQAGFYHLQQNRLWCIIDTGTNTGKYPSHLSTGAFEFGFNKQRIVTSCGTVHTDSNWADMLRNTAAHSTLILSDHNSLVTQTTVTSGTSPTGVGLQLTHDGYGQAYQTQHTRHIDLVKTGDFLSGQDVLTRSDNYIVLSDVSVTLRFHLHVSVQASAVRNNQSILLLPTVGPGWEFTADKGIITLEDSILTGFSTKPRRTQQIVVTLQFAKDAKELAVNWGFKKI